MVIKRREIDSYSGIPTTNHGVLGTLISNFDYNLKKDQEVCVKFSVELE